MTWLKSIKSNLPLLGTIILSSVIIFYKFPFIPQNLAFDEVEFARLALSLQNGWYTPYSPLATGHSTLYFYIILGFFKVFGANTFALRLPSAIFGVMCSVLFYLVIKETVKDQKKSIQTITPFLFALIFLSMRWFFEFARFSFEATFLLFLELASLYFSLRFLSDKNKWFLIFSGLFAGLAYNSYTPGRIFFLIPLFILIVKDLHFQIFNKENVLKLGYFVIPFVLLILPLTVYISQHGDTRVNEQLYTANSKLSPATKTQYFFQNLSSNALSLHIKGDVNGRHNYPLKPALNPVLGIVFLAGLIVTLLTIRTFYNQLFLLYLVVSLLPTLLTYPSENPHMLRTFTIIPSIVFISGNVIIAILKKWSNKKILLILFLLVALSVFYELRTYFVFQTQVFPKAFEMKGTLENYLK